jgi:RNA polymerase sigma factor (sigma-70 family)
MAGKTIAGLMVASEAFETHLRIPEAHVGLAYSVANKWANKYNIPREELVGPAAEGILRALQTWEPEKGAFTTYGVWWAEAKVREYLRQTLPQGISLDEPLGSDEEALTLGEVLASSLPSPEEKAEERLLREEVRARIAGLPPLLRQYALLRMGVGRRMLSPLEAAAFLGIPPRKAERYEEALRVALSPLREWL